jgi:hypothetical protein
MNPKLKLFFTKTKIVLRSVFYVLRRPIYLIWLILGTLFMVGSIIWSLNLDLVGFILFEAPLSFLEKLEFFFYTYESIFLSYNSLMAMGIVTLSLLFGINLVMVIFVLKNRQVVERLPKKSGLGAFAIAVASGGCIACGTSIFIPLLAFFGVGTSAVFVRNFGVWLMWLGSIMLIYSIYKMGTLAATIIAKNSLEKAQK